MRKALVFDFSRVLLFSKDDAYTGSLNEKHRALREEPKYNLLEHFSLNDELLGHLSALKPKYRLFIFTSDTIQDDPSLQPHLLPLFDGVFSAKKMGVDKRTSASYRTLANEIGLDPSEITYVDDNVQNTKAATSIGMKSIHYKNNLQLFEELPN